MTRLKQVLAKNIFRKSFDLKTFDLYMHKYPWYPMSPTIHKVLVHGFQINNSTLVPLGCLGEHASEAPNEIYKKDRLSHAKKIVQSIL